MLELISVSLEMKRTQVTLEKMSKILTENDKVQEIMAILAAKAEKNNLSPKEWENVKTSILSSCYFMIAQKDEQIRNELAMDLYEEFNS